MNSKQLLASLGVSDDDSDGVYFDGDSSGQYVDWSSSRRTYFAEDGESGKEVGRHFEIGDGEHGITLGLDWAEIERLHKALTILLLNHAV